MTLEQAAAICHRAYEDQTTDLADTLIGEARLREARELKQAAVSQDYRAASKALEAAQVNLHAHARGMVPAALVPVLIKQAREALDIMERASA